MSSASNDRPAPNSASTQRITEKENGVRDRFLRPTVATAFRVLGFVALLVTASTAYSQTPARVPSASDLSAVLEATTRAASPSVVEIFTTSFTPSTGIVPRSADLVSTQRASGSGVIVDREGFIVTNAHVVGDAQRVRVELPVPIAGRSILANRSRTVSARIIGVDMETDLAVIKIDEPNLPALPFGDSDQLSAGQIVMALGSPLGLRNSVSLGVVSAVARQLEPESPMIYVQTDASINPGSSGGPLVDLRGRVVGINTLIFSKAGGNEGVGFAAPSNVVRSIYEQIRKHGRVRRGDIGIRSQTITPVLASGLGLTRDYGVVLADVLPGTPGARAGLRPGDLVLTLDGKTMENGRQLHVNLYRRFVGDVVTLEVLRDGQTVKVPIAMMERRDTFEGFSASSDPRENLLPRLGILALNLDRRIADLLPVVRVSSGVVVASTVAGAIDAKDGGLAAGDVIFAANRTPIAEIDQLRALLDALKPGDPVVLQLERRGELTYLAFTLE
jgi:serine protease Do